MYEGLVSNKEDQVISAGSLGSGLFIIRSSQNNIAPTKFYLN